MSLEKFAALESLFAELAGELVVVGMSSFMFLKVSPSSERTITGLTAEWLGTTV